MKKISAVFDGFKFAGNTLVYAIKIANNALLYGVFPDSLLYKRYVLNDRIGNNSVLEGDHEEMAVTYFNKAPKNSIIIGCS